MEDILKLIIENLVDEKDSISIEKEEGRNSITYKVKVAESDIGKVIGRRGKIATSVKTIMKSIGAKEQKKVFVDFVE